MPVETLPRCQICHRPAPSTRVEGCCEGSGGRLCYQLGYRRVCELLALARLKLVELGVKVDGAIAREAEGGDRG